MSTILDNLVKNLPLSKVPSKEVPPPGPNDFPGVLRVYMAFSSALEAQLTGSEDWRNNPKGNGYQPVIFEMISINRDCRTVLFHSSNGMKHVMDLKFLSELLATGQAIII